MNINDIIDEIEYDFLERSEEIKNKLGIILPLSMSIEQQRIICQFEVKFRYKNIISRPEKLKPLKIVFEKDEDNNITCIIPNKELYKMCELVEKYPIPSEITHWTGFDDLSEKILNYQKEIYELNICSKSNKSEDKLFGLQDNKKNKIFSEYKVVELIKENNNILEHPSKVIESETLYNIKLPELNSKYKDLINSRNWSGLSKLQVETVLYASMNHDKFLSTGERKGYLISDGTGIGKGRQISGIISYNFDQGRKKSLWVSVSNTLLHASIKDMNDIRSVDNVLDCKNEIKIFGLPNTCQTPIFAQSGVLFITYKKLISQNTQLNKKRNRYDQICEWLGDDFDGVIVFDECHSAKSFSEDKTSKTGEYVFKLQKKYPNARIIYSSASSASEIKHLAYMYRLGLWDNCFSNDFKIFKKCIESGGVGALELLSCELKKAGSFCSRSLSYEGTEFDIEEITLTEEEEEMYNKCSEIWLEILKCIKLTNERSCKFWSAHQRFFLQLILSLKIKKCVEIVKKTLRKGMAVVIGLFSTGESSLKRSIDEHFSTLKEIITNIIPKNSKEYKNILDKINSIQYPDNPLDDLKFQLGGDKNVAEISGRTCKLDYKNNNQKVLLSRNSEKENLIEMENFQNGTKSVAIITEAASVGISLHAKADQKRRLHIILQLPWSAEKAMQQLGRTHRSNESSAPHYKLILSPLAGEKRLISEVANRLRILGAITNGDRRANDEGGNFLGHILCHEISKSVISSMNLENRDGYRIPRTYSMVGNSPKPLKNLLNKLLGLPPKIQTHIFSEFIKKYDSIVEKKKKQLLHFSDLKIIEDIPNDEMIVYEDEDNHILTKILTYNNIGCVITGNILIFIQCILETINSMKFYDRSIFGGLHIVFVYIEDKWVIGLLFPLNLKKTLIVCIKKQIKQILKSDLNTIDINVLELLIDMVVKNKITKKEILENKELIESSFFYFENELQKYFNLLKLTFKNKGLTVDTNIKKRIFQNSKLNKIKKNFIISSIREKNNSIVKNSLSFHLTSFFDSFSR